MYCHLVSIEVCVECGTYKRMKLNRLTLYEDRLKCLDTESVQRGSAVQHNRMLLDHIFEYIPYLRFQAFHHFLRALDIMRNAVHHKFLHHKGLEQLQCHLFWKTALINL